MIDRHPPVDGIAHGGGLARAIADHGGSVDDWLDLSTGINPDPAPLAPFPNRLWHALPDDDLTQAAIAAARAGYGVPAAASILPAPGVQALIQLLPWVRPGAKAAVLGPTYGEYVHVFQSLGAGASEVDSPDALADAPIAVIVNPNNPDGRCIDRQTVVALARAKADAGGLLIVDEAFADLYPDVSVAHLAGMPGLLVLKSFGKFYGLAGLRLGFALGDAVTTNRLAALLGPWAVSGPALAAGAALLPDRDLRQSIAEKIAANAAAQRTILGRVGLRVIGDAALFQLVDLEGAEGLRDRLARHHILTRAFAAHPRWLRFGLCANAAQRNRLEHALIASL
ncbi:MAG: threonine-phosphate decarboxylase CobD [Rhizobiaceae bacterium]|jgi:cobalamin biosynthetic protein CobC|nr:threonine-phosphate decarboxylase CobD [Rhizobiaceae bacterium]